MNIRRLRTSPVSASTLPSKVNPPPASPLSSPQESPSEARPEDVFVKGQASETQAPEQNRTENTEAAGEAAGIPAPVQRLDGRIQTTGGGVRLEKERLLTVLRTATQNTSPEKTRAASALHQEFKALAKHVLVGKDQEPKVKTYESLEKAVEAANQNNAGSELIVAIQNPDGKTAYAVIELKGAPTPESLAAAVAELGPQAEAYFTRQNGELTSVKPPQESSSQQYQRVKALADVATADNARGFDRNRAGTQEADRGVAYRANLSTAKQELDTTLKVLDAETRALSEQVDQLRKTGELSSPEGVALQKKLSTLHQQRETLETSRTIIHGRLLQIAPASGNIPGTEQGYGALRNRPEKIQAQLQERISQIDSRLMVTRDPALREQLQSQKQELRQEMIGVSQRNLEHREAGLRMKIRLGALAKMNQSLQTAHDNLTQNTQKLMMLEDRLPHLKGEELAKTQADIQRLRAKINGDRKTLINEMETAIGVFKKNAQMGQKGAQDAVTLLEEQVKKLKSIAPGEERNVLTTVDATRELLLESVKEAGRLFVGITPKEASALVDLDTKTDDYISDYLGAESKLEALKKSVSEKQSIYNDPAIRPSLIGEQQMTKLQEAYVKNVQKKIKDAKTGDLKKLGELYAALEMANNPKIDKKLRDRIDVDAVKAKIAEMSNSPEVMKAFDEAKQEAVKEVFGEQPVAQELKAHLLNPRYQAYLDLLPETERKAVLEADLAKLAFADPRAAAEVQQELVGREFQAQSVVMIKSVPADKRASAFSQAMDKLNTGVDKNAKIADALAQTLDKLTPEEAQKTAFWIKQMQNGDATAGQKLKDLLISKVGDAQGKGKATIHFLERMSASGKLGGLLALTAVVTAGFKLPEKFDKEHAAAIGQFGVAAVGATSSSASFIAGLIDFDADTILKDIKNGTQLVDRGSDAANLRHLNRLNKAAKVLKVMEFLGPIGDIAGAGFDFYAASDEFSKGDTFGGSMKVLSGASGVVGAGAGIAIVAGASGPLAPAVLIGATVAGLVFWGADEMWGESDEETFLRNLGVLKPA